MPTYEYRCKNCGEHLEVVQSFKDEPLKVCPTCEGELRKVFSPIGISFKGSGFYKTDSRSSSSAASSSAASKGDGGSSKSESSSSSEGSGSDSAAKADSKPSDAKPKSEPKAASAS